jgi:glycosyltransferase involved in cell wall biosynthesis
VLTPSEWSRRGLVNSGVPEDRIYVVPHGVNANLFRPLDSARREQLRTKARAGDDFVFLHVSDLSWSKGLDILMRAFAEVARRHSQVRLVLKGMDIPHDSAARMREVMTQLTEEQRGIVEPRTRYLGDVARFEKLANLFQIADAYVSPYRGAAFHRPALEAAACGVPVIVTAGGATDDFINKSFALPVRSEERPMAIDDVADALVLWPDESHLVEQMCRVIEDSELGKSSREAGPAAVANGFTWTQVVDRLLRTILPA